MNVHKNNINFNTNQAKGGKIHEKTRILVAPLDWGLGHATRCIPLIKELIAQDCEVWIACDGAVEMLLKEEFPALSFLGLPGYNIHYARSGMGLFWALMKQLPKIYTTIRNEHKWLKQQVELYAFDVIIADNRYGLYHDAVHCIFITHQLRIKSPLGKWNEKLLRRWNYGYINRFSECWIPDIAGENSLTGELSHPEKMPAIPVKYLGHLSRFSKNGISEKKNHLLVLLSGPEPQRRIFENQLIEELVHANLTADVVRGLPLEERILPSTNHLRFHNHLPAAELNKKMAEAEFVISRCGYSTVMDIVQLQKKSILIPTPGQTEQEYLAVHLTKAKIAFCLEQDQFSLLKALEAAKTFSYQLPAMNENLKEAIQGLLSRFV